ncbi:DUF6968 family protein [Chondromyces crocatus]|uniref:DUF6968 domain-containing protein n=1 Tax=Chondromyces crocatus TaxID=52 RepID=A0A0K1EMF1_CHOCO|nr:uncharacterized protein CMC5_060280 [Chondromyces crocatus]
MKRTSKDRPLAVRNLQIRNEEGKNTALVAEIYPPTRQYAGMPWECRYRITGLQPSPIEGMSAGEDGIQSLHHCIQDIANRMDAEVTRGRVSYPDGERFDNLELCRETIASKRPKRNRSSLPTDASLVREIRKVAAAVHEDPVGVRRALRVLRRRASAQGLIADVLLCLESELAAARVLRDDALELRLLRSIAQSQPSAANLAALADALVQHGHARAARAWLARAAAVVESGTRLERLILHKIEREGRKPDSDSPE